MNGVLDASAARLRHAAPVLDVIPMMLHLFDFHELSTICGLGVSDSQAKERAEERRRNPSFGLAEMLRAIRRFER